MSSNRSIDKLTDKRQALVIETEAFMPLGVNGKSGYAIVDAEDAPIVNQFMWYLSDTGYAMTTKKGTHTRMHHLIFGKPEKGFVVDHINRNRLDNRKSNLRLVTLAENARNAEKKSSKYPYRGVRPNGKTGWMAYLTYKKKQVYLGTHRTIEAAALAYNSKAKELFGEFAVLNKVKE